MIDLPPDLDQHAAGPLGAFIALLFLKAPLLRSVGLFLGGSAAAYFGGEWLALRFALPGGLAGFALGLTSMAVAAKGFETWDRLDLVGIVSGWLRRNSPVDADKEG